MTINLSALTDEQWSILLQELFDPDSWRPDCGAQISSKVCTHYQIASGKKFDATEKFDFRIAVEFGYRLGLIDRSGYIEMEKRREAFREARRKPTISQATVDRMRANIAAKGSI